LTDPLITATNTPKILLHLYSVSQSTNMMKKSLFPTKWMSIASLSFAAGATMATAQNNPAGNAQRGDQFFQTSCALCHSSSLGPGNTLVIKQGPTLVGVMGRKAGTSPRFGFSQALKDSGLVWNAETLGLYLTDPTIAVPGTTMPMPLPDASDRADVIAYLATLIVPDGVDLEKLPTVTGPDPDDWQQSLPPEPIDVVGSAAQDICRLWNGKEARGSAIDLGHGATFSSATPRWVSVELLVAPRQWFVRRPIGCASFSTFVSHGETQA
jgi:cytochrome c2